MAEQEVVIGKEADLQPDSCLTGEVAGRAVVVFRNPDGSITAMEDCCSHAAVRLSGGKIREGVVECPAHGARFDTRTGRNLCLPAVKPLRMLEVRIQNGDIVLKLP